MNIHVFPTVCNVLSDDIKKKKAYATLRWFELSYICFSANS